MRSRDGFSNAIPSGQIVVADTSPLNYLVQIGCDFLLPLLYRCVTVPPSVMRELSHANAPPAVESWMASLPDWIEVSTLKAEPDPELALLDAGERDAIQLALEIGATTVLIDERQGRLAARARGLSIVGTIGVLLAGQRFNLVDAQDAYTRLIMQTNFHHTSPLFQNFQAALRKLKG